MRRISFLALLLPLVLGGCGEVRESWQACAQAARDVHRGDAAALCQRFSEPMLSALPCDAVDRVLRQTRAAVGEPVGECRWAFTYRIHSFDPLAAAAVYKCPFAREKVKVTVAVEVRDDDTRITGLWTDSALIRSSRMLLRYELCRQIDEERNACIGVLSKASWSEPRISVWNQWQNLRGGDEITWEWSAPNGDVVAEFTHQVEESPPFDYRSWSYIEPRELETAGGFSHPPHGTWSVKVGLNGEEVDALHFEVVPADTDAG